MAEFKKKSYNDEDRKKWGKVFTSEYMSSDESGIEDGKGVIFVKDLPWRHKRVAKILKMNTIQKSLSKLIGKPKKG